MCSISGVVSKKGKNVFKEALVLLDSQKHRGQKAFGLKSEKAEAKAESLKEISPIAGTAFLCHSLLSTTGFGVQPFSRGKVSIVHNGQIYNYEGFLGNETAKSDSEAVCVFLEKELKKSSLESALKKFSKKALGDYSLGIMQGAKLFAFRDFLGLKPLWFGENSEYCAFASEPNALAKIDIHFPQPLLPGHLLALTKKGLVVKKVFDLNDFRKTIPKKYSFEMLEKEFGRAIDLQARGIEKAAVLFSGGVDSSLVAKAVSERVPKTVLFVCGTENSPDVIAAESASKELGLPLEKIVLNEKDAMRVALRTVMSLGFFDEMQIGIGMPELACAERIKELGFKVVFSGQGSDEIFCGYNNYSKILAESGFNGVEAEVWFSLSRMWSRNFYRDDKIVASQGLELRVPFMMQNFLGEAMAIPAGQKILSEHDAVRKWPVRKLAQKKGISDSICLKPKKAMQYGAGTQKIVSRLFH